MEENLPWQGNTLIQYNKVIISFFSQMPQILHFCLNSNRNRKVRSLALNLIKLFFIFILLYFCIPFPKITVQFSKHVPIWHTCSIDSSRSDPAIINPRSQNGVQNLFLLLSEVNWPSVSKWNWICRWSGNRIWVFV